MKKLEQALRNHTPNSPLLMMHVVLGYPSLEESIELVRVMAKSGASIIELQIPFSDPIADGATIMEANQVALQNGVKTADCMRAMKQLSEELPIPLLFMSYANILLNFPGGIEGFCKAASNAGAEGLIVPDIPPEESAERYWELAAKHNLAPIPIVSPVTTPERMKKIAAVAQRGFIYCVTVTGTTGARTELPPDLANYLSNVKQTFSLPRAVGFGISTRNHINQLAPHCEIAVVGSATVDIIRNTPKAERAAMVAKFTAELAT